MFRKISFIVLILGLAFLLVMLTLPANELMDGESLNNLEVNSKVFLEGKIIDEKDFGDFKVWKMDHRDFALICDCKESYLSQNLRIEGVVDEYEGEKQIRVLKLEVLF